MASSAARRSEAPIIGTKGDDLIRVETSVTFTWVPNPGDSWTKTSTWYDDSSGDYGPIKVTTSLSGPSYANGFVTLEGVSSSAAFQASASDFWFGFANVQGVSLPDLNWGDTWSWDPTFGVLMPSAGGSWDNWIGIWFEMNEAHYATSHWSGYTDAVDHGHWTLAPDPHDVAVFGGEGNDTIYGGQGDQLLSGDDGNDVLFVGIGADTALGGTGNDVIHGGIGMQLLDGGEGRDMITGGTGEQTLLGGTGADVLQAGRGSQTILGGTGNDTIHGGWGAQLLMGEAGRDYVQAGHGNQTLVGGAGRDVFAFTGSTTGQIVITDFMPGQDWIEVARGANGLPLDGSLDLLSLVSADDGGAAVLDFGVGATVTLSGISAQRAEEHVQDWFRIV